MRRARAFLAVAALAAVLVVGLLQAGGDGEGEPAPGPSLEELRRSVAGAPGPLAALYAEANRVVPSSVEDYRRRLRSLRGHPVVVNVWGAWCGPCKLEFPYFQRAAQRLGKRVAFLGVDIFDNRERAEAFLGKRPVPYPSLYDRDGKIMLAATGGARSAPITVFHDASGRRTFVHQGGYRSERDLIADIQRYTRG